MPVLHDSEEWRALNNRMGAVEAKVAAVDGDVKVLAERQKGQHDENQREIKETKSSVQNIEMAVFGDGSEGNPGIDKKLDRLLTIGNAAIVFAKVGAWFIGPGTLLLSFLYLYRTAIGK